MYFWNIKKLKDDLRKRSLTEGESFKYLFAMLVTTSLAIVPTLENSTTTLDVYSGLLSTIVTAAGIYYVYKCNNGAKGKNFLQKYVSMGWVLGIRWIVFILAILVPFTIALSFYLDDPFTDNITTVEVILTNLVYASYYWLLGKHIKEIAQ